MRRVVTPLDAGEINVPNFSPPLDKVYYVIFENADGDLRNQYMEPGDKSWLSIFKALHHVTIGAHQLHQASIAHQDIKPSNILYFEHAGSKISDLGRVTDAAGRSPFSNSDFTGDRSYAPIEISYGVRGSCFTDRFSSDVYMVGGVPSS